MSKYTITIKKLIDNNFSFSLNDYPIFNEDYRQKLNQKILNHYYMHEIGFETAELFNFYLKNTMNEIMPYYNELYKNQEKILDSLFDNININETFNKNIGEETQQNLTSSSDSKSNSTSNNSQNNKHLYQDTPQGKISITDLENQKWATNFDLDKNSSNSNINDSSNVNSNNESNTSRKETETYNKNTIGSTGKYNIEILKDIKNNLLNIDMLIINELKDLFMGLM